MLLMLLYKVLRQLRFVAHVALQSLRQLRFVAHAAHAALQSTKTIKVCSSCYFTKY